MDIFIIFIVITLRGMKAFLLNFLVEGWGGEGGCSRSVSTDFRVKDPWGCTKSWFSEDLCTGNWMEKLVFCAVFISLFVHYLFIYCLCVCLLFIYFYGAVCWVMRQLCGLTPLEGGRYFYGVVWQFWWVSCSLFCSPMGLMQDVMKSLPSFLTYCHYCLYLFILKYTLCV